MYELTFFALPPRWMLVLTAVVPLVAWIVIRRSRPTPLALARTAVAAALGLALLLFLIARRTYEQLLYENGPVELWTALALFLAGWTALRDAAGRADALDRRLLAVLGGALVLAACEELSWGQNLFQWQSPEFFRHWNAQKETNLHNITQRVFHTKGLTIVVLLAYGVAGPWLARRPGRRRPMSVAVLRFTPPRAFAPLFGTAALLCLDVPTDLEAELGELLGAVLFSITLAAQRSEHRRRSAHESARRVVDLPHRGVAAHAAAVDDAGSGEHTARPAAAATTVRRAGRRSDARR